MFKRRSQSARRRSARSSSGLKSFASSLTRALNPAYQAAQAKRLQARQQRRAALKYLASNPAVAKDVVEKATAASRDPNAMEVESARQVFGRGGYWGSLLGGLLGGLTGNSTIKGIASSIGDKAGDFISDRLGLGGFASGAEAAHKAVGGWLPFGLSGRGDYSMGGDSSQIVPSFGGGASDNIRIRSREYLGPVLGSSPLRIDHLLVNPGDATTFPKLSKMAMFYQQYIMNGCIFYYKSTSGMSTNSADTAIGQLHMAADYDTSNPLYSSKQDLVGSQYHNACLPSQHAMHGIECAAFTNGTEVKRVRHGDELNVDPMTTDVGRFYIAVEGTNAAASRIGELWVTYDVTLIKSRDSKGAEVVGARIEHPNSSNLDLLGSAKPQYNTLGIAVNNNTISFPKYVEPGVYMMVLTLHKNTAVAPAGVVNVWQPPLLENELGLNILQNRIENFETIASNPTAWPAHFSAYYLISIDQGAGVPVVSVKFNNSAIVLNDTVFDSTSLFITRMPDAMFL